MGVGWGLLAGCIVITLMNMHFFWIVNAFVEMWFCPFNQLCVHHLN